MRFWNASITLRNPPLSATLTYTSWSRKRTWCMCTWSTRRHQLVTEKIFESAYVLACVFNIRDGHRFNKKETIGNATSNY